MPLTTIDGGNAHAFLDHIQQAGFSRGLLKRDYGLAPSGYKAAVPTYPDSLILSDAEIAKRLKQQQKDQASLYDLRMANYDSLKSLDQDGVGYCWAFSSTKATMYARVLQGLPPLVLSAWYVGGKVKNWRDEGGWGAESADFIARNGAPIFSLCPGMKQKYDTADCEANAELHQIVTWFDGTSDRAKNRQIMLSAFALGGVPVLDFNWLGHSMCGCRALDLDTIDTDNSWGGTSQFGEKGLYRLSGSHAIPDNICVVFATEMSDA